MNERAICNPKESTRIARYTEDELLGDLRQLHSASPGMAERRVFRVAMLDAQRAQASKEQLVAWRWARGRRAMTIAAAAMLLMGAMLFGGPEPQSAMPTPAEIQPAAAPVALPVPMAGGGRNGKPVPAPIIKLQTSNPNVVVYWVNANEEEHHV